MKTIKRARTPCNLRCVALAVTATLIALASPRPFAQEAAAPVSGNPIPEGQFKSWSLFVICNPNWLLPQNDVQIEQLFEQFQAYGDAIGPDHVAVWFWSENANSHGKRSIDTRRNSQLCAHLKLPPSKSPYLIFTTHYPGRALSNQYPQTFPSSADLGDHLVLSLNGTSAVDTTRILTSLADKLVAGKLSDVSVGSAEYWSSWQKAYEAVRDEIGGLLGRVTISFDTGFVKTEIKLSKSP